MNQQLIFQLIFLVRKKDHIPKWNQLCSVLQTLPEIPCAQMGKLQFFLISNQRHVMPLLINFW